MDRNILSYRKSVERPIILDGAIGSLLQTKVPNNSKTAMWASMLNLTNPGLVRKVHREYIAAGAEIITTNTFRTNPAMLEKAGIQSNSKSIVKATVELVHQAIEEEHRDNIFVAGSNPPAEDSYQKERTLSPYEIEYNHKKHIELLWESGCDFILNETQSHFDEIKIITEFCTKNNIPFVISIFFNKKLNILSGDSLGKVITYLSNFSPLAISINCIGQQEFKQVISQNYFSLIKGIYLNTGSGKYTDKHIVCGIQPDEYLNLLKPVVNGNYLFVGSCCGSNPAHTQTLKEYLSGQNNR